MTARLISELPMEAAADLSIRRIGINPNCWYMIAQSAEISERPLARELWHEPVVLFRGPTGEIHALEDRCPHRLVKLSHGKVIDGQLECAYHGWCFDTAGECVRIPHLVGKPSLPDCAVRRYPVIEKNGFAWIFPGDPQLAESVAPLAMEEWDDLNEIRSVARLTCRAHFSYLIENLMDMYHGRLHAEHQVWTAHGLREVRQTVTQVTALYNATTCYRIESIGSMLQLFIPGLRKNHEAPLTVTYDYPNWRSTLGDDFKIFCLLTPVNERLTDAYLIHYTSLAKFSALRDAPEAVRKLVKKALNNVARRLLQNLVREDVLMIEEEQAAFDRDPTAKPLEVNRTVLRVQQLIRQQAAGSRC